MLKFCGISKHPRLPGGRHRRWGAGHRSSGRPGGHHQPDGHAARRHAEQHHADHCFVFHDADRPDSDGQRRAGRLECHGRSRHEPGLQHHRVGHRADRRRFRHGRRHGRDAGADCEDRDEGHRKHRRHHCSSRYPVGCSADDHRGDHRGSGRTRRSGNMEFRRRCARLGKLGGRHSRRREARRVCQRAHVHHGTPGLADARRP